MFRPRILPTLALLAAPALAVDPVNEGTLTMVAEPGFNQLSVELFVPLIGRQTKTSILTGTALATLNINTSTDQTTELTLSDGDIEGSPVSFSISGFFGDVIVTSTVLGGTIFTTTPPGPVTPSTGGFDGTLHQFIINEGTLSGTALGSPIGVNMADSPFSGTGNGTGTVTLTRLPDSANRAVYEVTTVLPLDFVTLVPTGFSILGSEITAEVTVSGRVKGKGQVSVPLPYPDWATAQGIPGAPPENDSNSNGVQNGITWALGLGLADDPRPHLLLPNPTVPKGFILLLPATGSSGALTVEASADLSPDSWLPLAPGDLSSGANPIPPGSTGNVIIDPTAASQRYLRLMTNP